MSVEKVLNEDWSQVDNKKKRWEDRGFVSCEESYEIEYLVKAIKKHYPTKTETAIRAAIASCCKSVSGNKPRRKFVECVTAQL